MPLPPELKSVLNLFADCLPDLPASALLFFGPVSSIKPTVFRVTKRVSQSCLNPPSASALEVLHSVHIPLATNHTLLSTLLPASTVCIRWTTYKPLTSPPRVLFGLLLVGCFLLLRCLDEIWIKFSSLCPLGLCMPTIHCCILTYLKPRYSAHLLTLLPYHAYLGGMQAPAIASYPAKQRYNKEEKKMYYGHIRICKYCETPQVINHCQLL